MYTDEQKDQFTELRAEGHSLRDISLKLNIPRSTLALWNKEQATYLHNQHRNAVQDKLGSLAVSKAERVDALAFCFKQLEKRLRKTRNPTTKDARFYELLLKYDQYMNTQLLHEGNPVSADEAIQNKPPIKFTSAIPRPWDKCTCNTGPIEDCYFHGKSAEEEKAEHQAHLEQRRQLLRDIQAELAAEDDPDLRE